MEPLGLARDPLLPRLRPPVPPSSRAPANRLQPLTAGFCVGGQHPQAHSAPVFCDVKTAPREHHAKLYNFFLIKWKKEVSESAVSLFWPPEGTRWVENGVVTLRSPRGRGPVPGCDGRPRALLLCPRLCPFSAAGGPITHALAFASFCASLKRLPTSTRWSWFLRHRPESSDREQQCLGTLYCKDSQHLGRPVSAQSASEMPEPSRDISEQLAQR